MVQQEIHIRKIGSALRAYRNTPIGLYVSGFRTAVIIAGGLVWCNGASARSLGSRKWWINSGVNGIVKWFTDWRLVFSVKILIGTRVFLKIGNI